MQTQSILARPDDKLLIRWSYGLQQQHRSGAPDIAFSNVLAIPSSFFPYNNNLTGIHLQKDDKSILLGSFTSVHSVPRSRIARLNSDGTVDLSFARGIGFSVDATGAVFAEQTDGKLIVSGSFTNDTGHIRR